MTYRMTEIKDHAFIFLVWVFCNVILLDTYGFKKHRPDKITVFVRDLSE